MSFDFASNLFAGVDGGQNYLAELERFLAAHPPGKVPIPTLNNGAPSVSSSSDSSSPASSVENSKEASSVATATNNNQKAGDKRKPEARDVGSLKDRRKSSGSAETHTHNEPDEDEEQDKQGKGKAKTSDRRKLQNRNAQRAFRERKEKHLKELEDQVQQLEKKSTDQASENSNLKELVSHLQKENERLKVYEAAFTFNFQNSTSSSAVPNTPSFGASSPSNIFTGLQKSGENTTLASLSVPTPQSQSASLFGTSAGPSMTSAKSAADIFASFGSSTSSSPSTAPVATPSSTTTFNNIFNIPFGGANETNGWRESSNDLASFSGSTLNDFPDLFFAGNNNNFDFLKSSSNNTPSASGKSPSVNKLAETPSSSSILDPEKSPLNHNGVCAILTQAQALGGKDAGFNFDVDQLCSELKAKAQCQEMARKALEDSLKDDIVFSFQS
ncbi:hypothetical protein BT69DRAFT_1349622 [Atractiella rhizophila]|nr:hypothetical protein BT69DRAFT_1349622 [Atractiella rhizophila]